ncbi:MAG: transposase [Rhodospirillaceae bacterium]|nr:transposase [Rhodospirillaceae bacterium]MYK13625.1 transposase [Rhodospirillaceae bacterium]
MSDSGEQSSSEGRVRRRRRRWSEARKRRIVAESYQPGVSVSVVARRHDVNANLVFNWRRQYRDLARMAGGFVPVVVSSTEGAEPATPSPAPRDIEPSSSGRIEIALADGSRVTVDRDVDAAALSRVLEVLERR